MGGIGMIGALPVEELEVGPGEKRRVLDLADADVAVARRALAPVGVLARMALAVAVVPAAHRAGGLERPGRRREHRGFEVAPADRAVELPRDDGGVVGAE